MAAKYISSDETENKHHRFLDVGQEPRRMLQPIEGYQKMSLVSLEKAVESVVFCCPDIHRRAFIAMSNCEDPADGLDQNESASIFLYTMEWEPRDECLYYVLNKTLRTENRQQLKPWYAYLKLLLTALQKLPPQKLTVWRGVTLDLNREYEIGKRYVWWAFSSCTGSVAVLESDLFLGKYGPRTLFNIECHNGKTIRSHSYIHVEDEILLLPATQFEVISKLKPSADLHIIHLKEVDPPFSLIELPSPTTIVKPIIQVPMDKDQASNNYRNKKLEELIAQCPPKDTVDLESQGLTDNDMSIIIQQAIIDKQCSCLCLTSNMITDEGIQQLAKILQSSMSLTILGLGMNRITDTGAHQIAQALHSNKNLLYLSLIYNQITNKGAQALAQALELNSTLKQLWISGNPIGDTDVLYLAQASTKHGTLETLDIASTGLTDDGAIDLAKLLKQNVTLRKLVLDNNPLTNKGVKIILDALCHNHGLQRLDIECSAMASSCMKAIQKMFEENNTLTYLSVLQTSFTDAEQDQLRAMAGKIESRQINFKENK